MTIKFKSKSDHTKYHNKRGDAVPSCTTILKVISKPMLQGWANGLGFKKIKIKDELNRASYIGTTVHHYIECILNNEKIDFELAEDMGPNEKQKIMNALSSFVKWWKENKDDVEVIDTELTIHGEYYGGTIDLVCKYKKVRFIIDFKTSKSVYSSMFLQIAGYAKLYEKKMNKSIDGYGILLLDKSEGKKAKLTTITDKKVLKDIKKCFINTLRFFYSWYELNQKHFGKSILEE
jgi:hypothetical protein